MISFLPRRYIADRQSQPRVPALQQPLQHVLLPHPLVLVGRPYRSLNLQFTFKSGRSADPEPADVEAWAVDLITPRAPQTPQLPSQIHAYRHQR